MIIENPDALRAWLTAWLGPKCDADPAALSKYVMALVKKDKTEKELKDICIDQLDVFLQRGTKQFVDLLFETLNSKSYLESQTTSEPLNGSSVESSQAVIMPPPETSTVNGTPAVVSVVNSVPPKPLEMTSVSSKVTPVVSSFPASSVTSTTTLVSKPDSKRPKSGNESDERDAKRSRLGRSKTRSKSPPVRSSRSKLDRDNDDRRSRRFPDDDRRRKNFPSRPRYDNRYRDFRGGRNMPDNDRDRDRQIGRSKDRKGGRSSDRNQADRGKSRSRSGSPWNRNRSRSWSRSSSRSRSPSRSRSRSWSRSRDRNRDSNRNDTREGRNAPPGSSDHGDKDYRDPPTTGANATAIGPGAAAQSGSVSTSNNGGGGTSANPPVSGEASNFRVAKHARRCRDYDEKGYCMRGDLCPFDHGMDPVILEDVSVLPGFPQNENNAGNQQNQMLPPPPGVPMPSLINPVHNQSNVVPGESFLPEPYNPLEPGMERPPRMRGPFWGHPPPPHGPPGSGPPLRPPLGRGPPHMFHPGPPQRTRELIGVPTVDNAELSGGPKSVVHRTVLEPLQQPQIADERPNPVINSVAVTRPQGYMHRGGGGGGGGGIHDNGSGGGGGGFRRRMFDYNRLGPRKNAMNSNVDRCTLELRKVPRHQNTITELNSHFSKFGTIVNLQVCYGGDPEAALIQFSSHTEANAAYRCTDAVLNNRFIKVFWHNKENSTAAPNNPVSEANASELNENKTNTVADSSNPDISSSTELKEGLQVPPVKSNVKDRLGIAASMVKINNFAKKVAPSSANDEVSTEKAVLFTPSGNLSRTVYNPLALKKNNLVGANTLPRKTKEEQRKEVLKKKLEVQNKRQQIIQMHVQQQKLLFTKLEKCKNDKEKAVIMETLKTLSNTIDALSNEVRKNATDIMGLNKSLTKAIPKTKTDSLNLTKAEKELLDAEMDLYNKQHRGDDTTELRKKVNDLKQQAKALGLLDSSGHLKVGGLSFVRGGGVIAGARYRGRGAMVMSRKLTSVDRRPKKIIVEGAADLDGDTLLTHFSQCSSVERLEMMGPGIALVTFKTRRDAEKAFTLGAKLNEKPLKVKWYSESSAATGVEDSNLQGRLDMSDLRVNDENLEQSEDEEDDTLLGDDEEEEDSEARSWRR